jgi:hypothetical protein
VTCFQRHVAAEWSSYIKISTIQCSTFAPLQCWGRREEWAEGNIEPGVKADLHVAVRWYLFISWMFVSPPFLSDTRLIHIFSAGTIIWIANYRMLLQVRHTTATFNLALCVIITLHCTQRRIYVATMRIWRPTVDEVVSAFGGSSLWLLGKPQWTTPVLDSKALLKYLSVGVIMIRFGR